jgi:SAM-dependent methyltransferase
VRGHSTFDDFADDYASTLNRGLAFSGENKDFYARARIEWLADALAELGRPRPERVVDFGCGTGTSVPLLADALGARSVLGIDVSERSIDVARRMHGGEHATFQTFAEHEPAADADLAFCNGVFHHIPPSERADSVRHVWRSLAPGGIWAFWENNPYNPGTQWLMHRLPFDRGVVKISAAGARRLLRAGGFEILRTAHLFLFPKALSPLRRFERRLSGLPLGAQFVVLAQKAPASSA